MGKEINFTFYKISAEIGEFIVCNAVSGSSEKFFLFDKGCELIDSFDFLGNKGQLFTDDKEKYIFFSNSKKDGNFKKIVIPFSELEKIERIETTSKITEYIKEYYF